MACVSPFRVAYDSAFVEVTCNGQDYSYNNVPLFYYGTSRSTTCEGRAAWC